MARKAIEQRVGLAFTNIMDAPNSTDLTKVDSVAAIESLWPKVIAKAGLNNAELLSVSYFDLARRVYVRDMHAHKITLLQHESTSRLRALDLQGEFAMLRHCAGISGVPAAINWRREKEFEMLTIERMGGEAAEGLGLAGFLLVLRRLCVIGVRLSYRGVSHNDIKSENVLLTKEGNVSLIDFDQATLTGFTSGILRSFFGIKVGDGKVHGSLMSMVKEYLRKKLPPRIIAAVRKIAGRELNNQLPILPEDASSNAEKLLDAWGIAQNSDASSPNLLVAYYSFNFEGHHFPGERSWEDRWEVLRAITDYSGRRVLELGCNMSFLSCFLLKEAKAAAAMGVDIDASILKAAKLVSSALGVDPVLKQQDFDAQNDWEKELTEFRPDIVFALNVLNWVQDKERFLNFLGTFDDVIMEGHDDFESERGKFIARGFKEVELVGITERNRPVIHCLK